MVKELVPIIFTCTVWEPYLAKKHINFQRDNANLVISINKDSSKEKLVMHLLHSLTFFVAHFDIYLTASGIINVAADHLSRGSLGQAFPSLSPKPTLIPPSVFQLISP